MYVRSGDRRFKLEFPWDKAKSLQLRANTGAMKKSWMDVLKATIKEASAQIQGTGSVFAYGGKRIILCMPVCMNVCMLPRLWINRVRLPILLVVS